MGSGRERARKRARVWGGGSGGGGGARFLMTVLGTFTRREVLRLLPVLVAHPPAAAVTAAVFSAEAAGGPVGGGEGAGRCSRWWGAWRGEGGAGGPREPQSMPRLNTAWYPLPSSAGANCRVWVAEDAAVICWAGAMAGGRGNERRPWLAVEAE